MTAFTVGVIGGAGLYFLTVERSSEPQLALRIKAECDFTKLGKETCFAKEFYEFAREYGYEKSFAVLAYLQNIDSGARGCHFIAHSIGLGTYDREPGKWQEHVSRIPRDCSYGAIHGVVEKHISSTGRRLTKEVIPKICGDAPRADCNHIIGHLILVDPEIKGDVGKGLEMCSILGGYQNYLCLTGVFMEWITALNLIEHGFAPRSFLNWPARVEELKQLCFSRSGIEAEACWEEIAHVLVAKFPDNAEKVFSSCEEAPADNAARRCINHSIGIIGGSRQFALEELKDMCKLGPARYQNFSESCYRQLVISALATIPRKIDEVKKFCFSLAPEFINSCLEEVERASYVPEQPVFN